MNGAAATVVGPSAPTPAAPRVISVDVIRGLTILAPVIYALFGGFADLTGTDNPLHTLGSPFALGLARSIAMALLVCGIAAWLTRRRVFLRL